MFAPNKAPLNRKHRGKITFWHWYKFEGHKRKLKVPKHQHENLERQTRDEAERRGGEVRGGEGVEDEEDAVVEEQEREGVEEEERE